jgi:hypothetical protein
LPDPVEQEQGPPGGPGGAAQHQPDGERQIVPGVCGGRFWAAAGCAATKQANAINLVISIILQEMRSVLKSGKEKSGRQLQIE